jgi:hypothetical protein
MEFSTRLEDSAASNRAGRNITHASQDILDCSGRVAICQTLFGVALSNHTQMTYNKGGNYFAWALGAGVNRRISDGMAIRVFLPEHVMNRNEGDKNNHVGLPPDLLSSWAGALIERYRSAAFRAAADCKHLLELCR